MSTAALEQAIVIAGGQTALAEKLSDLTGKKVGQSMISMWLYRGRVPPEWVILVETAVNGKVTRCDIRPDLYPRDEVA
jgi:DNA-binding transcriptional regulator YdaS (Cro superfamily)